MEWKNEKCVAALAGMFGTSSSCAQTRLILNFSPLTRLVYSTYVSLMTSVIPLFHVTFLYNMKNLYSGVNTPI